MAAARRDPAAVADPDARRRPAGADRVRLVPLRHARRPSRDDEHFDADALDAYAQRMARLPEDRWPDALLLLGDQVYADETSAADAASGSGRAATSAPAPNDQVADFEEYTWLYHESWADPEVRWLLSTLPGSMIFDDHDVRDDWNTSQSWRQDMKATSWWQERIVGGLSSYWVYQHLGNLSPAPLAEGRALSAGARATTATPSRCCASSRWPPTRRRTAARGRGGPTAATSAASGCWSSTPAAGGSSPTGSARWSSEAEFGWIEEQVDGDYDHLLIGTSLPWLLARALHDIEAWNEALGAGARGPRMARWAEKLRRAADLEHWAAFRESFERLAELFARVGRGRARRIGRRPGNGLRAVRRRPPRLRRAGALSRATCGRRSTSSPAHPCTTTSRRR